MGEYSNHGKEVCHLKGIVRTHIADAEDNEKAHFLATAANAFDASREVAAGIMADTAPAFDYVSEARLTCSPSWHGELVSKVNFVRALNASIEAANQLDRVKKTLFYGRDNNLQAELGRENLRNLPAVFAGMDADAAADIVHGIIGVFTEAGELLEALRDAINEGKPFDMVNLKEEVGDGFWYQAIIAFRAGFSFDEAQRVNIDKLRARFPDRFTEYDANNRNLVGERAILEGGIEYAGGAADEVAQAVEPHDIDEQHLPLHRRSRKMEGERNLDGDALEAQKPTNNNLGDKI